ncbi:MAG: response regulator [Spirochaetaceae bacterium]
MGKMIFLVEDEHILNIHLKRFLEKNGYSVEVFSHGEPCLERLDSGNIPDLILMDINLGDNRMDGPTVTKKIHEKYDIPVVLHSAYTDKDTLDSTRDMTKYGYVQKVPGNEQFILATAGMALKLHSTETELKRRENLYRELSAHLQHIREEQNAELSREIHDDLGQSLTALKMNITFLEQSLGGKTPAKEALRKTVHDMERIVDGTVKKVRKISTELRPSVLDTEGIVEALQWQVEEFRKNFNISVVVSPVDLEVELGERASLQVFRIVQESLTNCVRHSGATEVHISTEINDGVFSIVVEDNGNGFDTGAVEKNTSFGLIGMRERARQCAGSLDIESSPGRGTRVRVAIPIPDREDER